ncbi:MAG: preprotein translocase subunit SecG [Bacteroidota bacterium]
MYQFVTVLIILVSILLIMIVLVQNSKGGGLANNFAGSNQVMGVKKTTDFLEKATWTLASVLVVLAFVSVMVLPRDVQQSGSAIDEELENMSTPQQQQQMPDFGVGGEEEGEGATQEMPPDSM